MPIPFSRAAALVALAAAAAALAGCRGKAPDRPAPPPPEVTVVRPVVRPVQAYLQYNGHLDAIETVEVRARVKGYLTSVRFAEGTEVEPGALLYTIDKREYLTALEKAEAELENAAGNIFKWEAQLIRDRADLRRVEEQLAKGVGVPSDRDKVLASLEVSRSEVVSAVGAKRAAEAARRSANIQLGYTEIAAKIGGRISRTLVTEGNLVGQTDPTLLTTIVRMDELYVYFDAPERDLVEYQRAQREEGLPLATSRTIPVEVGIETEDGFPHRGVIDFQENRVNSATGTVRVRGRVPNPVTLPDRVRRAEPGVYAAAGVAAASGSAARLLYPGLYARVRIPQGAARPRLVIPEEALMAGQEGQFVYVVGPDNVVQKRVVTVGPQVWREPAARVGPRAPGWAVLNPAPAPPPAPDGPKGPPRPARLPVRSVVAVDAGLAADDRVVVVGMQRARPTFPVAPAEWVLAAPKE